MLTPHSRKGHIDDRFQEQYARLLDIRNQLERLSMTQAWSLRETDLFQFQRKLDRIDEARVNGNFIDANGQPADLHAQRVREDLSTLVLERSSCLLILLNADTDLSDPSKLRVHLRTSYRFRASIRSAPTDL